MIQPRFRKIVQITFVVVFQSSNDDAGGLQLIVGYRDIPMIVACWLSHAVPDWTENKWRRWKIGEQEDLLWHVHKSFFVLFDRRYVLLGQQMR